MPDLSAGGHTVALRSPSGTMDPSPYTQFLADLLVERDVPASAVDVGCGTGALAILLAELGVEQVYAVDINPAAVEATRVNAALNGVEDRVDAVRGDVVGPLDASAVDLVVSNPPSLPMPEQPSSEYAFHNYYGGSDGRQFIQRLVAESPRVLREGGELLFINTSLANVGATVRQLPRAGLGSFAVDCRELPFREPYYEYFDWFEHQKERNRCDYRTDGDRHYEILYATTGTLVG